MALDIGNFGRWSIKPIPYSPIKIHKNGFNVGVDMVGLHHKPVKFSPVKFAQFYMNEHYIPYEPYEDKRSNIEIIEDIPHHDVMHIVRLYENDELDGELAILGRGVCGKVYGYKNYAIKKFHASRYKDNKDIQILKDLRHLDCVPNIYAVIDDGGLIIMERVFGMTVGSYVDNDRENSLNIGEEFMEKWRKALKDVIKAGYSPQDMHGHNVMIDTRTIEPKLVDVGFFTKRTHSDTYIDFEEDSGYKTAEQMCGSELRIYLKKMENRKEKMKKYEELAV